MAFRYRFDPVILREYDIRGTVGKNLNVSDAEALGKAFGTLVLRSGGRSVVVGYDGRTHSPDLEKALVEGLVSTGVHVERIGLGPTPMMYFSTVHLKTDAGIMVTGSHNPPDQNGFKMLLAKHLPNGGPIYGKRIKELAEIAAIGNFEEGKGSFASKDVREDYVKKLAGEYKGSGKHKVVWDNGNGAAGEILSRLVSKIPGKHIVLYPEIDGRFPNHHPDPSVPANMKDLQETVLKEKADLGIAFDGDADRIGAVDGEGRIIAGDQLIAIYAADVLKRQPGATIIADVKASQVLFDQIAKNGGKPIMWKTGNTLIKAKMAEENAPLAGEMSGHIFFGDNHNFDDAIYAAVKLLSILNASGRSLAEMRDDLPSMVTTPEILIKVDEDRKFALVEEIKRRMQEKKAEMSDIDGVRVKTEDGWWLLRASNTQAAIGARIEAKNEDGLNRLKKELADQLSASGITLPAV